MPTRKRGGLHQWMTSMAIAFLCVSVSLLSMLPIIVTVSENAAAAWAPEQQISVDNDTEMQWYPDIAVEGDKVHVVWEDDKGERGGHPPRSQNYDIYYRYFNGVFWETPQLISDDVYYEDQRTPAIAVEGGEVHVVWYGTSHELDPFDTAVYYRHFNGLEWEPKVLIDVLDNLWILEMWPSIAVEEGRVHVVWSNNGTGVIGLFHRYFNGSAWQPTMEITADIRSEHSHDASIALIGDEIHVTWTDSRDDSSDIIYRHFDGSHWEPEIKISTEIAPENQWLSSMGASGDQVHVVWQDKQDGSWDIHYRQFDGTTWLPVTKISTDIGSDHQGFPRISVDGNNVYVVWHNGFDGRCGIDAMDCDIYYRYFDGTTWWPEQEISTDIGTEGQWYPAIAAVGDVVNIVWMDEVDGDWDIYYRSGVEDLTPPESSVEPILPYWQSSSIFDVGWTARDGSGLSNISLYYRHSSDNSSWTAWDEWAYDDTISGTFDAGIFPFAPPNGEGYYQFRSIATDDLGRVETPPPDHDAACGYDLTPPSSSVDPIFPYWHSSSLTITATADDTLSGVANVTLYYRFSSDNSSWNSWNLSGMEPLSPWKWSFDFPDSEGHYEFHSIAVDVVGNVESKMPAAEAIAGLLTSVPMPPNDLSAVLSGVDFEDVLLSWALSPDDGMGRDNVARYEIHRGSVYDPFGSSYVLHASVPSGTSVFTDVGAGEGNASNYFYRVSAVSVSNATSFCTNQAGKLTRPLSQGQNLISIPLIQSNESIETVLQTVKYDKAWYYDSTSQEWKWYMTSKAYRRGLWSVNRTIGAWVNVTEDSNLTVAGIVPAQTTIHLSEGWNLVSFPSFNTSYTVYDLKMDTGALRVEGYDPTFPYHLRVLGDAEVLRAGHGYWVRVEMDTVWTIAIE